MKKNVLTSLLALVFGFTYSQNTQFGIKGGMNVATQTSTESELVDLKTSSLIGFHIGGFVEFKLSDKFSVQPELLYSAQGGKYSVVLRQTNDPDLNTNAEVVTNLSYINIPVMFKYYVIEKLSLEAGPQIGILISSKEKITQPGSSYSSNNDNFEPIDFGLNLGAGYDITENISAGVRYNLGFYDVEKGDIETKNNVLSLSVGYKF